MNYKEITANEYEKLLQNKKNIFNNTFKNTNKLVEDRKQISKTDPDAIIKKQQKDEYIEKLSDLISQKSLLQMKEISNKIDFKDFTDRINFKKIGDKIELKNDETSQTSYKNDYTHYIKNPNILADKIVEIYDNNPNVNVYNPKNKDKPVKLQNVVNKIDKDDDINEQYEEFVNEFRNIPGNTKIKYDYQTYKDLILDRINNEEVEASNDESFLKEAGKEIFKKTLNNITGQGINEYKMIKIDKDALKKNILKIRYNNGRKLNNKYLHNDMIISNNMKNAIMKNTHVNKLSKNEYNAYTLLNKYKNDNTNLLILSYLAGNNSTDLYNTINKNLCNKLKNNQINKQNYNNILKKINNNNM